jgi:hypothetical protein
MRRCDRAIWPPGLRTALAGKCKLAEDLNRFVPSNG